MLAIPFGVIGVIWGHIGCMGFSLTFLSMIGFVALSGIVVNDSLILVQFYNTRSGTDGMPMQRGTGRGWVGSDLRPIFLTTITTVLGLTPLMLEQSFQAKIPDPDGDLDRLRPDERDGTDPARPAVHHRDRGRPEVASRYYLWHGLPRPERINPRLPHGLSGSRCETRHRSGGRTPRVTAFAQIRQRSPVQMGP